MTESAAGYPASESLDFEKTFRRERHSQAVLNSVPPNDHERKFCGERGQMAFSL